MRRILIGNDIFRDFMESDGYYVDKTEPIYELVAETGNKVTLFTCPRRFGKTLTMSMIERFFDCSNGRNSRRCFRVLTSCKNHLDSNDEAGSGRLDLRIKDRPKRLVLLLELKRVKTQEALHHGCEEAIAQIINSGYARTMAEGYEQQIINGIAFCGKTARIKQLTM